MCRTVKLFWFCVRPGTRALEYRTGSVSPEPITALCAILRATGLAPAFFALEGFGSSTASGDTEVSLVLSSVMPLFYHARVRALNRARQKPRPEGRGCKSQG